MAAVSNNGMSNWQLIFGAIVASVLCSIVAVYIALNMLKGDASLYADSSVTAAMQENNRLLQEVVQRLERLEQALRHP